MERVDTLSRVETKTLNDGRLLYLIWASDDKDYSTMKRDLAKVALQAVETKDYVRLGYEERQKGDFTNRYLNEISVVDGAPEQGLPGLDPFVGLDSPAAPVGRDVNAEKDLAIAKAVGLKAGIDVMQYLPEDQRTVSNVTTAAEYFTRWLTSFRP